MNDCLTAREALSALRDDEAASGASQARQARAHLRGCLACRAWQADLDRLTPRLRLSATTPPDLCAQILDDFDRRRAGAELSRRRRLGRALLVVAGMLSVAVGLPRLLDAQTLPLLEHAAAHLSRELAAAELAWGFAFLLAARRPERFVAGLLPMAVAFVVVLGGAALTDLVYGQTHSLLELAHLPAGLGLAGLVLSSTAEGDPATDGGGRDRREQSPTHSAAA